MILKGRAATRGFSELIFGAPRSTLKSAQTCGSWTSYSQEKEKIKVILEECTLLFYFFFGCMGTLHGKIVTRNKFMHASERCVELL